MKVLIFFALFSLFLTACTPKIQLETPPEGLTINMNVVVDHKIDVQMDKQSRAIITTIDQSEQKAAQTSEEKTH